MDKRIPGAGKSSFDLIDRNILFAELPVKKGDSFLDLGCGRGEYSIAIAKSVGKKGRIVGIDLWEEGIAGLRKQASQNRLKNVFGVLADVREGIPLRSKSIDFCLMATVLHDLVEIDAAEKTLDEIQRVLKENGVLSVVEFKKIDGPPGPPITIRLAPEEVKRIVTPHGFRETRVLEVGPYNYLSIFLKKSARVNI